MSATPEPVDVLVLAGSRATGDPLCVSEGVASKAVVDIGGQPMLARVLKALGASRVRTPAYLAGLDAAALGAASGGIKARLVETAGRGPASALLDALNGKVSTPLLVTTCDHALLTPEMVDNFLAQSVASGADMTVGLAERATIEATYPQTKRTYLRFGGAELSGCNLFYLANERALNALRFWQDAEHDRKRPWRIIWRFGALSALRIWLFRPGVEAVLATASRRVGARIRPVILPFAEAAIDVDTPGDLELVRAIIAGRAA